MGINNKTTFRTAVIKSLFYQKGVHLEEPTSPITKHWNEDLDEFVRQLTHPKGSVDRSQSIDVSSLDKLEKMKLQPSKQAVSDEHLGLAKNPVPDIVQKTKDKKCDTSSPRKSWRRHILQRKNGKSVTSANSTDVDEAVEVSFGSQEDEGLDLKDVSFDSSSSGVRDSKASFHCDSSENSDQDSSSQGTSLPTTVTGQKTLYQKRVKDSKDSKRQRFRRMITRPLRRSHSAGCEKDIPVAHALFLQNSEDKPEKDTMESRAADLSLYHRQLFGDLDSDAAQRRPVHKTCSADAAMMATDEYGLGANINNNNPQTKSKSRNLAKNMKRKFQFLRRRNTDTALGGAMVTVHSRPSSDQATQWSQSFDTLLNDKCGLDLFHSFLRSEFSEENLEFWIACQDFKTCKDGQMSVLAQRIYSDYVAFQAPKEINLDSKTRMNTITQLDEPNHSLFDQAQKRIQALMEKDSYPRFLESDIYLQLVTSSDSSKC